MAANKMNGSLRVAGGNIERDPTYKLVPDLPRSNLEQENLVAYPIPLADLVVWDSGQPLPAAAAADDLAHVIGTFGTACPVISAGDVKTLSSTRYARFTVPLPAEYVAGETVVVRLSAGMKTTVASTSCTVDVQAYKSDREGLVDGADLCATAAQDMNSLAFGDKDFTITPTGLQPGDLLDVRVAIAFVDAATGTAVTPTIGAAELLCDVKG